MNGGWGTPTARTIEWYDPKITATAASHMSGLEFLRAIADGKLPPAPIASLLGFRVAEVEHGRVVFEVTPDESVYNPIGVVHGGLVCTLADTVAACAVHSSSRDGGWRSPALRSSTAAGSLSRRRRAAASSCPSSSR